MQADLGKRLERLPQALTAPEFLRGTGLGNEINFHIFAYLPQQEPVVEGFLPRLEDQLRKRKVVPLVFHLFREITTLLDEDGLLEAVFELEEDQGTRGLAKALQKKIHATALADRLERKRQEQRPDLVLITGVGAAYPLIRSHLLLSNLHARIDDAPVVLFFPGTYNDHEFRLFDRLMDDHYYRAFPLLDKVD